MNLRLILPAALALASLPAFAQAPNPKLKAVLDQMDAASASFKNARADFQKDFYERAARDTTTETGAVYFERTGSGTQMGAASFDPATKKKTKVYDYKAGVLRQYEVGVNQVQVIKPSNSPGQIEAYLTLGFGGSGKDLAKSWNITDLGQETLTDNGTPVKCEKLDLVSKDPGVRNTFTHVTIWVDPTRAISLKQLFETPSHDTQTSTYSHIKVNTKIDTDTFAISKSAKVIMH